MGQRFGSSEEADDSGPSQVVEVFRAACGVKPAALDRGSRDRSRKLTRARLSAGGGRHARFVGSFMQLGNVAHEGAERYADNLLKQMDLLIDRSVG